MAPLGAPRKPGNDVETTFAAAAALNPTRPPDADGSVSRVFNQPALPRDLHCVHQPGSLQYLPKDILSETLSGPFHK